MFVFQRKMNEGIDLKRYSRSRQGHPNERQSGRDKGELRQPTTSMLRMDLDEGKQHQAR